MACGQGEGAESGRRMSRAMAGMACPMAIAELYAVHPGLRIVFCANRKMANEWARNYFAAVWAHFKDTEA